jgi:hypothetical protein
MSEIDDLRKKNEYSRILINAMMYKLGGVMLTSRELERAAQNPLDIVGQAVARQGNTLYGDRVYLSYEGPEFEYSEEPALPASSKILEIE